MKTNFSLFLLMIALMGMVACTPIHDQTIANLKAAIDGECTASAKYATFSGKASLDNLDAIAALFLATSRAEGIHIKNHLAALATLGVTDYMGKVEAFETKSTAENLQTAIDGETYEFTTMYPTFIGDAKTEKVQRALTSFGYAQDAEKGHAKLYAEALAKLSTPESVETVYYTCPICGNVYAGTPSDICELCQTPADRFLVLRASDGYSDLDGYTGATSIR